MSRNTKPNRKAIGFGLQRMLADLGERISWGAVQMGVELSKK